MRAAGGRLPSCPCSFDYSEGNEHREPDYVDIVERPSGLVQRVVVVRNLHLRTDGIEALGNGDANGVRVIVIGGNMPSIVPTEV